MRPHGEGSVRGAIREVRIRNFRGIERVSLSFATPKGGVSDIAVLAGPNGSGKTAVLEACLLALGARPGLPYPGSWYAVRAGAGRGEIEVECETPRGVVLNRLRVELDGMTGSTRSLDGKGVREDANPPCVFFSSWRAPRLIGPVPVTAGQREQKFTGAEEDRIAVLKQYLVNARAYESMLGPQDDGDEVAYLSRYQEVMQALDDIWSQFYPWRQQHFAVEPAGASPHAGFDVFLAGPGKQRVPLDGLSSGEIELVNFAGWMVATGFDGGIILIDEPELHLDRQWHAVLLRALRKLQPRSQFIVATHSPDIYDSVLSFERHLLAAPDDPRWKSWSKEDRAVLNR